MFMEMTSSRLVRNLVVMIVQYTCCALEVVEVVVTQREEERQGAC